MSKINYRNSTPETYGENNVQLDKEIRSLRYRTWTLADLVKNMEPITPETTPVENTVSLHKVLTEMESSSRKKIREIEEQYSKKVSGLQQELFRELSHTEELENQKKILEEKVVIQDQRIEVLEKQEKQLLREKSSLSKQLQEFIEFRDFVEEEMQRREQEHYRVKQKFLDFQAELREKEMELDEANEILNITRNQIRHQESFIVDLQVQLVQARCQLAEKRVELRHVMNEALTPTITQTISRMRKDVQQTPPEYVRALQDLNNKKMQLQGELERTKENLRQVSDRLEEKSKSFEDLKNPSVEEELKKKPSVEDIKRQSAEELKKKPSVEDLKRPSIEELKKKTSVEDLKKSGIGKQTPPLPSHVEQAPIKHSPNLKKLDDNDKAKEAKSKKEVWERLSASKTPNTTRKSPVETPKKEKTNKLVLSSPLPPVSKSESAPSLKLSSSNIKSSHSKVTAKSPPSSRPRKDVRKLF